MADVIIPDLTDEQALNIVRKARSRLLTEHPFFGSLAMWVDLVPDRTIGTMCTNGSEIRFDPKFVAAHRLEEIIGTVAHELAHCYLNHMFRFKGKNFRLANVAADYVVNPLVLDSGLKLPQWILLDKRFDGMSFEQVYAILERENPPENIQPFGLFVEPPPGAGKPGEGDQKTKDLEGITEWSPSHMTADKWTIAAEQARSMAIKAGKIPANLDRSIKASQQSVSDWRNILWRFPQDYVQSDYTWVPPNKRFASQGMYLPSLRSLALVRFPFFVDTSGSMEQRDLSIAASEIEAIGRELAVTVDVIYCDAAVNHVETFTPDDIMSGIKLSARGGGGTAFQPAFDWVKNNYLEPPPFAIYLTDLYGDNATVKDPGYPVLWITSANSNMTGPFGETIRIINW